MLELAQRLAGMVAAYDCTELKMICKVMIFEMSSFCKECVLCYGLQRICACKLVNNKLTLRGCTAMHCSAVHFIALHCTLALE